MPCWVEVTRTVIAHVPGSVPTCGGIVPPLMPTDVTPAGAFTTAPQSFVTSGVASMNRPLGRLSVTAKFVRGERFGLKKRMVKIETAPGSITVGLKLLLISAGMASAGLAAEKDAKRIARTTSDRNSRRAGMAGSPF